VGVAFLLVLETSASSPQPVQSSALLPMKGQVFRTAGYVCAASRDGPFPSIYVWPSGARGNRVCCDQRVGGIEELSVPVLGSMSVASRLGRRGSIIKCLLRERT